MAQNIKANFLSEAVKGSRRAFFYTFLFSAATNILMLAIPIYTLQVLDRVITSQSKDTLLMLTILALFFCVILGAFFMVRSFIMIGLGEWFEKRVSAPMLATAISTSATSHSIHGSQHLRDVTSIKQFMTGPGLMALFDAPWSLIYIFVLYMIHPIAGMIAIIGGVLLLILAILNEAMVKKKLSEANELSVQNMNYVDSSSRNAEAIEAMGMLHPILERWYDNNQVILNLQSSASKRSAVISSLAKTLRLILQITVIGAGAYLVLNNDMSVGAIIACSILTGRALSPFETAIGSWQGLTTARKAYERLTKSLEIAPMRDSSMSLPDPKGKLTSQQLVFGAPGSNKAIIKGVEFDIAPGKLVGIIGPSAAGKSTLVKLITGILKPNAGSVRLDGADVYQWDRNEFGKHVGYLPQDVELFGGTVRDNICRFDKNAQDKDIIDAAKVAGVHELILKLPKGYATEIGASGANLSGGQRQRLGLARAFYGTPKLIVLDEPNSNLDDTGDIALIRALIEAKKRQITVVIVSHRPSILRAMDHIIVMADGKVADQGPGPEILKKFTTPPPQKKAPPNTKKPPSKQVKKP